MPRRSVAYMESQRELIARAALACFREHGLRDTGIVEIAQAAGLSIGAIYAYFPGKQAILRHAITLTADDFYQKHFPSWPDLRAEILRFIRDPLPVSDDGTGALYKVARLTHEFGLAALEDADILEEMRRQELSFSTWLSEVLEGFRARGEIQLPLGTAATVDALSDLSHGAIEALTMRGREPRPLTATLDHLVGWTGVTAGNDR